MALQSITQDGHEPKELKVILANREFPGYGYFDDFVFLHPSVFTFFGLMGIFGLSSIGNPLLTNWELDSAVKTTMTVMMVGSQRHKRPFGTHMPSASYLPIEIWDLIVDEFIVPSCNESSKLNFEPLRVNSQFIDIVQKLDGRIFTDGDYKDLLLNVVDIPFNREFYIGRPFLYLNAPDKIFFLDEDYDYDEHYNYHYHTDYRLKYEDQPDWIPGEIRLVEFCEHLFNDLT